MAKDTRERAMPRLYKRGEIWWCWVYGPNGKQKCRTTRCTDKKAAEAIAREWERRAADPVYEAAKTYTIERCLTDFLSHRKSEGAAEGTLHMYRIKAGHWVRIVGADEPIANLSAREIDRYIAQRKQEGVVHHTIGKELVTLGGALKLAKRHGFFHEDLRSILPSTWHNEYKPRRTYLTIEEGLGLIEHLPPERGAHVAFVLGCAARFSESIRALRSDVDLQRGIVLIRETKTNRAVTPVPVVSLTRPFLGRALQDAPLTGEGPLFLPWGNARRDLAAACLRAGVPRISFNDLRRSTATWLVQAGVPLQHISRILRHKTTIMVEKVYGVMSTEALSRLIEGSLSAASACSNSVVNVVESGPSLQTLLTE